MKLAIRPRPMPPFAQLDARVRAQLGPLLEQAEDDGEEGAALIERFEVLDEAGEVLYEGYLFCGDDGLVHRAGTLDPVASVSQGAVSVASGDEALREGLEAALAAWQRRHTVARPDEPGAEPDDGPA